VLGAIIAVLCGVFVWAAVDAAAVRRVEVHALVLLAAFAASFVFLASSATAVVPTVAAIVVAHAALIVAGGTKGSIVLATAASQSGKMHRLDNAALSIIDVAALVTLMACACTAMCAVSRAEEGRSRGNFVKEFRRRREQRRSVRFRALRPDNPYTLNPKP
jgi:hypothetical protein